jgi:hypothetical protein
LRGRLLVDVEDCWTRFLPIVELKKNWIISAYLFVTERNRRSWRENSGGRCREKEKKAIIMKEREKVILKWRAGSWNKYLAKFLLLFSSRTKYLIHYEYIVSFGFWKTVVWFLMSFNCWLNFILFKY